MFLVLVKPMVATGYGKDGSLRTVCVLVSNPTPKNMRVVTRLIDGQIVAVNCVVM